LNPVGDLQPGESNCHALAVASKDRTAKVSMLTGEEVEMQEGGSD
jgi:hypothetical protein